MSSVRPARPVRFDLVDTLFILSSLGGEYPTYQKSLEESIYSSKWYQYVQLKTARRIELADSSW
jgi:hypothetical protein